MSTSGWPNDASTEAKMRALRTFEKCAFVCTGTVWICGWAYLAKTKSDTNLSATLEKSMHKLDSHAHNFLATIQQQHSHSSVSTPKQ
jgi:hypothetical protein